MPTNSARSPGATRSGTALPSPPRQSVRLIRHGLPTTSTTATIRASGHAEVSLEEDPVDVHLEVDLEAARLAVGEGGQGGGPGVDDAFHPIDVLGHEVHGPDPGLGGAAGIGRDALEPD